MKAYLIGGPADQTKKILQHPVTSLRVAEQQSAAAYFNGDDHPTAVAEMHDYILVYIIGDVGIFIHDDIMRGKSDG